MATFTKYMKDSFVSLVLDDVPQVDYSQLIAKAHQDDAFEQMPTVIKAVFMVKELHTFLNLEWLHVRNEGTSAFYAHRHYKPSEECKASVNELVTKSQQQRQERNNLRNQLSALVSSITTIKKAHKMLPEFTKYLPDEANPPIDPSKLPSTNQVVTKLVELGWNTKKD